MKHQLPELPFAKSALEPIMSAETLEFHHGKHHKAYVDKLNELIPGTEYENLPLERIIAQAPEGPIFNNAAQIWNHTFFWHCLAPKEKSGLPHGELKAAIEKCFGSVDAFKQKFAAAAVAQFGSGWAWLVRDEAGGVKIETTSNAKTPVQSGRGPLLTVDVWEHAYYVDYRNARPKFLEAIWNIINWDFAERNFQSKQIFNAL